MWYPTGMSEDDATPVGTRARAAGLLATALVAGSGVLAYQSSPQHALHDPAHALQQFDLLYLDEPAPAADRLGLRPGVPAVVFFCRPRCQPPPVSGAQVVQSGSPELARGYGLLTDDGRVGPGYALVDADGQLRYRTFDPGLQRPEIQVLVDGLP